MTDTNDLAHPSAPVRIWVDPAYIDSPSRVLASNLASTRQDRALPSDAPYILATREALAESPEVQRLIAEAEARGLDLAVGIADQHRDPTGTEYGEGWDAASSSIAKEARTAAAALRGEEKP